MGFLFGPALTWLVARILPEGLPSGIAIAAVFAVAAGCFSRPPYLRALGVGVALGTGAFVLLLLSLGWIPTVPLSR
jgi:hypothetical protein